MDDDLGYPYFRTPPHFLGESNHCKQSLGGSINLSNSQVSRAAISYHIINSNHIMSYHDILYHSIVCFTELKLFQGVLFTNLVFDTYNVESWSSTSFLGVMVNLGNVRAQYASNRETLESGSSQNFRENHQGHRTNIVSYQESHL